MTKVNVRKAMSGDDQHLNSELELKCRSTLLTKLNSKIYKNFFFAKYERSLDYRWRIFLNFRAAEG